MHDGGAPARDGHGFVAVFVGDLENRGCPDLEFGDTPADAFAAVWGGDAELLGCELGEADCDLGVGGEVAAAGLRGDGGPAVV